jgi:hypothetical protein
MKMYRSFILLMIFTLIAGSFPPGLALSAPLEQTQSSPIYYPILRCYGIGITGDRADLRGIQFQASSAFQAVELRMAASVVGSYTITAELRRSAGFTDKPIAARIVIVNLPSSTAGAPYLPVTIDFGVISVQGTETFTVKFTNITGQGTVYFETFGIGNAPCSNIMQTEENDVAEPTERGDPAGFKVLNAYVGKITHSSSYASTPPTIDGSLQLGEWPLANSLKFQYGQITLTNDGHRLYVLLNVLDDLIEDIRNTEYFYLTFDVDRDGLITPDVDLNYSLVPATGNMRYQYYKGPNQWTGLQPETYSSKARGFGCYFGDGSLWINFFSKTDQPFQRRCTKHLVWELAIDLDEIQAKPGDTLGMGVRIASMNPAFQVDIPANFTNNIGFLELIQVTLGTSGGAVISPSPLASIALESNPVQVTQAIQTPANTLRLVENKDTVARVFVDVNGVRTTQPSKVYLYGSRDGVDLPGSPLFLVHTAPTSVDRARLSHSANYSLPKGWKSGAVTFQGKVKDFYNNPDDGSPFMMTFYPRDIPVVWIVPINTGTAASPTLVADTQISSQESAMKAVYPVRNITFVRKPWTVIGPTTVANTITRLNEYHSMTVLAWIFGLIFSDGSSPFDLPDQIYGFTPTGGGSSDPTWIGNNGYVARGFFGTSRELTMAHEINHNLDRSSGGTWGRHTKFGCDAAGPDPSWPYSNDDIQELGFDTRLPWVDTTTQDTIVPITFPDFMSYCQSGQLPTKWISPYRWEHLFDRFPGPSMSVQMEPDLAIVPEVFYLSGHVNDNGTGSLDSVLSQPGFASDIYPGDYSIEIRSASDTILSTTPFFISFEDAEGEHRPTVHFNFRIPVPEGAAKIVLKQGEKVLDTIVASDHAPIVEVLQPNGGGIVEGLQTILWNAADADKDDLIFDIFYTPDDGATWYPVGIKVRERSYEVDFDALPGGDQAKIMVIASDGFHDAEDESDETFVVPKKAPAVTIQKPAGGSVFRIGKPVLFEGSAYDLEDGTIPDESLYWEVDGVPVAEGSPTLLDLVPGYHTVRLYAVDSQENISFSEIVILVGYNQFIPAILK